MTKAYAAVVVVVVVLSLLALACVNQPRVTGTAAPLPTSGGSTPQPVGNNPFGVMLPIKVVNSPDGMARVRDLGVTYFRPPQAVFLNQWKGSCGPCDAAQQAGFKLVLTISNRGGGLQPSAPPDNLESYKQQFGEVLDKYPPAVVAIENEENSNIFYSGTPEQYAEVLKAGCEVAHSKGIKCTNGGLVSALVGLLVWDHYVASGDAAGAQDFASKAFDPNQQRLLDTPQARAQIDKGKALLEAYRAAGIDYLNFHWYIGNTEALGVAVAYLREQLGVPLISNEVGQFNDDPNQTKAVMQAMAQLDIPIIIWFGLDGPKARGLMDGSGALRPTGQAFKEFIQQNYR